MKIALIGRYGEGEILNGPERVARELFLQLKTENVEVIFIEYFFSGYTDYRLFNKIFGRKIKEDNVLRLGLIPLLARLLKEQFDIIHFINSQRFQLVVLILKAFLKAKFISTLHGFSKYEISGSKNNWRKCRFLDFLVERYLIKKSIKIIFPSELLKNIFKNEFKSFEHKFDVIPNGIGKNFASHNIVRNFSNDLSFIFYNAFEPTIRKGLETLVDQLSLIKDFPIKMFVIGCRENILHQNENLEINFADSMDHKSFIDFSKDKNFIIKSGAFEPFSIIVAECMCLGIIPLVNQNIGIKDYIEDKVNGFIYNSKHAESLVSLLKDIHNNKFDLASISKKAEDIYNILNWEIVGKYYLLAYRSVL